VLIAALFALHPKALLRHLRGCDKHVGHSWKRLAEQKLLVRKYGPGSRVAATERERMTMKTQLNILGLCAAATMLLAAPAVAQTAPPANEATGLPYCSAKVTDKCIQRSDVRRVEREKAAAAKAM
jgi:hypothetical protein